MRPLDKGKCPIDPKTGKDMVVTKYGHWRKELISRIGEYCAYCNMPINQTLSVEHVVPKNPILGLPEGSLLSWGNMLLACVPCNGTGAKGNKPYNPVDYYTPEDHNPFLAFLINIHPIEKSAAIIVPHPNLKNAQITKAEKTICLFKWQKIDRRPNVVDLRWKKRREAIDAVNSSFALFQQAQSSVTYDATQAAEAIAQIAKGWGFFLLWFSVFSNEPTVLEKLLDPNIIPGTAQNCFNKQNGFVPISRNPTHLADPI